MPRVPVNQYRNTVVPVEYHVFRTTKTTTILPLVKGTALQVQ
jgi:hypothetical protein